jgi:HEAT repeat protein
MNPARVLASLLAIGIAVAAFAKKDPESLLQTMLYSPNALKRADAKEALTKAGAASVAPLVQALKGLYAQDDLSGDNRDYVRISDILDVLVGVGEPSVAPVIELLTYRPVSGIGSTNPDGPILTRSLIAQALGRLKDVHAVEPLIALLQANDVARNSAAKALGELGDRRAIEPLRELLHKLENDPVDVTKGGMLAMEIRTALSKLEAH